MVKRTQNFSISQDFDEVRDILENVGNKSQFICEAILHYYHTQGQDEELEEDKNLPEKEALKDMVTEILDEMLSDNVFLIKGNSEVIPKTINDFIQEDKDRQDNINQYNGVKKIEDPSESNDEASNEEAEDEQSLSAIIKDLADDDDARDIAAGMLDFM